MGINLSVGQPTPEQVALARGRGRDRGFNYQAVGRTGQRDPLVAAPPWNARDHTLIKIGEGEGAYRLAKGTLQRWGHFQLGWTYVDPSTPIAEHSLVCVVAQAVPFLPLWTTCPLEVVYTEETAPPAAHAKSGKKGGKKNVPVVGGRSFSYAHGCLGTHLLAGEERFSVEWRADNTVWYEISTFSHPAHPLAVLAYPLARWQQKRFGRESAKALATAVQ